MDVSKYKYYLPFSVKNVERNDNSMRPEQLYFRVLPRVVPCNQVSRIVIEPLFDYYQINKDAFYEVGVVPMEHRSRNGDFFIPSSFDVGAILNTVGVQTIKPENGCFVFEYTFEDEQEQIIYLREKAGEKKLVGAFSVYSLKEDLFGRLPLKGDLHMHSNCSDGKEPPAFSRK